MHTVGHYSIWGRNARGCPHCLCFPRENLGKLFLRLGWPRCHSFKKIVFYRNVESSRNLLVRGECTNHYATTAPVHVCFYKVVTGMLISWECFHRILTWILVIMWKCVLNDIPGGFFVFFLSLLFCAASSKKRLNAVDIWIFVVLLHLVKILSIYPTSNVDILIVFLFVVSVVLLSVFSLSHSSSLVDKKKL